MPLTDTAIRNAKSRDKQYKLSDEKGLYLLVKKAGKYFRLDYRFEGKRKTLALGVYPDVSLKGARERRGEARKLIANGVDPMQYKKSAKMMRAEQQANNLEAVAREWFAKNKPVWSEKHAETVIRRLELNVFPWLGKQPIATITAPELLTMFRRIEARGAIETAHRVRQICGQVFRYAIATGRAERDPSADLRGALSPTQTKHLAAITDPRKLGGLLRAIDSYEGDPSTRCALRLMPLVFVRSKDLRFMEWKHINFQEAEWKIPAHKASKKDAAHIVPLSKQAVSVLKEIEPLTGSGQYAFPSPRTRERPLSDNGMLSALRRMGFGKDEVCVHGFRTTASTLLNEKRGWSPDAIERQLAHTEKNSVRAAYNHAEYLEERRKMMQDWADYLDQLKGERV